MTEPSASLRVSFPEDGQLATVTDPAQTLLQVSLARGIPHVRECGGRGRCTTCRVRVLEGLTHLAPRNALEARVAEQRGWDETLRLACQTRITGDVTVQRLVRDGTQRNRILHEIAAREPGRAIPMAVLFCDLRNFTPIAERHLAFDVVHILNRYYERVGEAVVLNDGYIYQYVGDELVAWFGLSGGSPRVNCHNALRAALAIQALLVEVNRGLKADFGEELAVSIGLHFGVAIVGTIGHATHKQLTAVGDTINFAKRVESMNREAGTTLLASAELLRAVPVPLRTGQQVRTELKGFSGQHELTEVLDFAEPDALLIVQRTAERLLGQVEVFGPRLYENIFALAPDVRALFSRDVSTQSRMFVSMLRMVLQGLARYPDLVPGLREEGKRHAGYGVRPHHYQVLLEAFLRTLQEVLGEAHTPQVQWAWEQTLRRIAQTMQEGAGQD